MDNVVLGAATAFIAPFVASGLLSTLRLPAVAAWALLLALVAVAVAILVAWRRRGWLRWRPVLVGALLGVVVTVGGIAWFLVLASRALGPVE